LDEEEKEESDEGRALPKRCEPEPSSPRAAEAEEELAPGAGAGAPVTRQSMREAARAAEVSGGAAVATSAADTTPVVPQRKRKRGVSTLR
jgi:hypothetical protein